MNGFKVLRLKNSSLEGVFMSQVLILAQIIIFLSIWIVWVFRFDNIVLEFQQYGFSSLFRNFIGALKISLASIILIGIWNPHLVLIPSIIMALLMLAAQWTHFRVRNPFKKYLPSMALLVLCLLVIKAHAGQF